MQHTGFRFENWDDERASLKKMGRYQNCYGLYMDFVCLSNRAGTVYGLYGRPYFARTIRKNTRNQRKNYHNDEISCFLVLLVYSFVADFFLFFSTCCLSNGRITGEDWNNLRLPRSHQRNSWIVSYAATHYLMPKRNMMSRRGLGLKAVTSA